MRFSEFFTDRFELVDPDHDNHINFEVEWRWDGPDETIIEKVVQYDDDWVVSTLVYDDNPDKPVSEISDKWLGRLEQQVQDHADDMPPTTSPRYCKWLRSRHK